MFAAGVLSAARQTGGQAAMGEVIASKSDQHDAMRVQGVGDISFIWGREGEASKGYAGGYGVAKVVAKHGKEAADAIPKTLALGQKKLGSTRVVCTLGSHRAVLTHGGAGPDGPWLLTAYDVKRAPEKREG